MLCIDCAQQNVEQAAGDRDERQTFEQLDAGVQDRVVDGDIEQRRGQHYPQRGKGRVSQGYD